MANEELIQLLSLYSTEVPPLIKLEVLILCSIPPKSCELIYLVSQTEENEQSGLGMVARMPKSIKIGILGSYHPAISSSQIIRKRLCQLGVSSSDIVEIDLPHPEVGEDKKFRYHNTRTEMEMVVEYCVRNNITTLGVCAPPFHQARAYMSTIHALRNHSLANQPVIFSFVGTPLDWTESVCHSQGTTRDFRHRLVDEHEIPRIFKYWQAGELISPSQAVEYFLDHSSRGFF